MKAGPCWADRDRGASPVSRCARTACHRRRSAYRPIVRPPGKGGATVVAQSPSSRSPSPVTVIALPLSAVLTRSESNVIDNVLLTSRQLPCSDIDNVIHIDVERWRNVRPPRSLPPERDRSREGTLRRGVVVNPVPTHVTAARGTGDVAALTFDDGPSGATTTALLDFLKERTHPRDVLRHRPEHPGAGRGRGPAAHRGRGRTLGNHATSVRGHGQLDAEQIEADLVENLQIIRDGLATRRRRCRTSAPRTAAGARRRLSPSRSACSPSASSTPSRTGPPRTSRHSSRTCAPP